MKLVFLLTFDRITALVPGMRSHIDGLINGRLDLHHVSCAGRAAPTPSSSRCALIVEHQEVVIVPVCSVKAYHSGHSLPLVVLHFHKEKTVVFGLFGRSSLSSQLRSPKLALIGVIA